MVVPALLGQQPIDQAVQVTAEVQTNPPTLALSWVLNTNALSYTIYRKSRDATTWGAPLLTVGGGVTNYVDTNVAVGMGYEYRISKSDLAYGGEGYLYSGIEMPLVEQHGTVLFLVDQTQASALTMELARLQQDLVGDGWTVIRHDVARTDSVPAIKALIMADYLADSDNVNTIFLFGHVPVPYAGDIFPTATRIIGGLARGRLLRRCDWNLDGFHGE